MASKEKNKIDYEKIWECRNCRHEFVPNRPFFRCPKCNSIRTYPTEKISTKPKPKSPKHAHAQLVEVIEKTAYDLGANLVGFTEVTPDIIPLDKEVPYRYVVVVAIKMDNRKIATAPSSDSMFETSDSQLLIGVLIHRLSAKIKEIGYDAVSGPAIGGAIDYPSLARMAGMGEYGRHGLLISQFNGSCQRLAAIFTNLELPIEKSNSHEWIRDFCSSCGKCIRACPPNAIRKKSVPTKTGFYSCVEPGKCLLYLISHYGCSICIKECPFTTIGYDRIKEAYERERA